MPRRLPAWLDDAVFYQVYPQSFSDSNADGIGDIGGIIKKLDYLRGLGINALWINPWFVSPFQDAGYDVADYYKVAPRYGSNAGARRLFLEARKRGIRVCLDLVPGHTSIEHPWFRQSCRQKPNKRSDWFIWTRSVWDAANLGGLESIRGFAERDGNYITNFFYSQPALNYGFAKPDPRQPWQLKNSHPAPQAVAAEMLKVMRFWLRMGASGFRVDMAGSLVKKDPGQKATIRLWQSISARLKREFPDSVLISEWGMPTRAVGAGFDIDFMLHFPTPGYNSLLRLGKGAGESYCHPASKASARVFLKEFLGHYRSVKGEGLISIPSGNHDMDRLALGRTQADLKCCFALILCLPSVPFIYYGDEIGMPKLEGLASKEGGYSRTGSRTPMQWDRGKNRGFSKAAAAKLYLPVDTRAWAPTVADQAGKPGSLLETVRDLLRLRRQHPALGAKADFKLLHNGSAGRPMTFLREMKGQVILVAVHPKSRPGSLNLKVKGWEKAVELCASGMKIKDGKVLAGGRSYGIWELKPPSR